MAAQKTPSGQFVRTPAGPWTVFRTERFRFVLVFAGRWAFLSATALLLTESKAAPFPEPNLRGSLLSPGKVDVLYRHITATEENRINEFLWTPMFKGGAGVLLPRDQTSVSYGGGFFRPLAPWPERGDLILGGEIVEAGPRHDYGFQGEYRFPMGLGFGGGFVDASDDRLDIWFAKITYRSKYRSWNFILEAQVQEFGTETSAGGYAAFYNDELMFAAGGDGEQWRVTAGYIAPKTSAPLRIAAEALYVDNSVGTLIAPRAFFGNLTLKYEGGFLSHPARLGRAMGPQGLEFGNPLGFLLPTWNRRLEVWELGRLGAARVERIELSERTATERYEALVFPFQFVGANNFLDGFFLGGAYLRNPARNTVAWLGGYFGALDPLKVFVGVEHEMSPAATSVVVGAQGWF